jgi:hypothetical protein
VVDESYSYILEIASEKGLVSSRSTFFVEINILLVIVITIIRPWSWITPTTPMSIAATSATNRANGDTLSWQRFLTFLISTDSQLPMQPFFHSALLDAPRPFRDLLALHVLDIGKALGQ